jgi:hypothetical protein
LFCRISKSAVERKAFAISQHKGFPVGDH